MSQHPKVQRAGLTPAQSCGFSAISLKVGGSKRPIHFFKCSDLGPSLGSHAGGPAQSTANVANLRVEPPGEL